MAATALLGTQIPRFNSSTSTSTSTNLQPSSSLLKTASSRRISLVRASSEPQRPAANDRAPFVSQELKYLVKLGVGSVAGAAAIKYGSILYPEMTQPNLGLALLIISAPVLVAVLILIKQSSSIE